MNKLTFEDLQAATIARTALWEPNGGTSLEFRGLELGGETGELQNKLKKYARFKLGMRGGADNLNEVAEELADVIISATVLANHLGMNVEQAVRMKFNLTSVNNNLPVYLS